MQCERNLLFLGISHRADASCSFHAQIFHMHIAPMVHMSKEKGWRDAQSCQFLHLVMAHNLTMNQNRANAGSPFLRHFLIYPQILVGSRIPIGMHQKLLLFPHGSFHQRFQFFVGKHRIPLCAIGIRFRHPCGLALRRTIQQDFVSAYFQMVVVSPFTRGESVNEFGTIFQIHISDNIQPQTILFI